MVLPGCFRSSGRATIELSNLTISEEDEQLLEDVTETLIPATDTPGAKELLLHLFVLKMVDDCHSPDDQQQFVSGLNAFAGWARKTSGEPFGRADASVRAALLQGVENSGEEDIVRFYSITKRRTIQGYLNSQYVMTNLIKYELVPGRYDGYVRVTAG